MRFSSLSSIAGQSLAMGSHGSKIKRLPASGVIIPLYMYPVTAETWKPLHQAVRSNPHLQFIVIVNPNSGPGAPPWWPNSDYVREVPKLNEYSNVCTLGYIRIDYCRRPLQEAMDEIAAYGKWPADATNPEVFVRGIFFDETPNHHDRHAAEYLAQLSAEVHNSNGLSKPQMIMHNPGTLPDDRLVAKSCPDLTVVCEESFERYGAFSQQENLGLDSWSRSRCCIILHTTPRAKVREVVRELRPRACYLFISDLGPEVCYEKWAPGWDEFMQAMRE